METKTFVCTGCKKEFIIPISRWAPDRGADFFSCDWKEKDMLKHKLCGECSDSVRRHIEEINLPLFSKSCLIAFDKEVEWILGRPNFTLIKLVTSLRKIGMAIKEHAEEEQAAGIYWMLCMYKKYGKDWINKGNKELKLCLESGNNDKKEKERKIKTHTETGESARK